jgi:hypothetical protein
MLHIWYVTFSNQFCAASTRAIIAASFERTTACELRGLPNTFLWFTHLPKKGAQNPFEWEKNPSILETFIHHRSLSGNGTSGHAPSLMIEIAQDDLKTAIRWSKDVLGGHTHVVEGNVRRCCSGTVTCLDRFGFNAFTTLDEKDDISFLCPAANRELYKKKKGNSRLGGTRRGKWSGTCVVSNHAIRDPFLGSVHGVILAVWRESGKSFQASDVASSESLGYAQTYVLLSGKHFWDHLVPDSGFPKVDDGRKADISATTDTIVMTTGMHPAGFLSHDEFVEIVELNMCRLFKLDDHQTENKAYLFWFDESAHQYPSFQV